MAATLTALAAGRADAQWYARLDAGLAVRGHLDGHSLPAHPGHPGVAGFAFGEIESGRSLHVGAGRRFGPLRLEAELSRRDDLIESTRLLRDGEVTTYAAMANALVDVARLGPASAYVGAGFGAARIDAEGESRPVGAARLRYADGEDEAFAYQVMAGVGWRLAPRLTADLAVRRFEAPELDHTIRRRHSHRTDRMESDYRQDSVTLGLRWSFGADGPPPSRPMPPPAPTAAELAALLDAQGIAPPPCRPTEFRAHFAFDSAVLSPEVRAEIERAGDFAKRCGFAGAFIVGHADASGPASYNFRLSQRRAAAVREILVARGLPPDKVIVRGLGETDLVVPTPDGVREPGNRRAVVIITFR